MINHGTQSRVQSQHMDYPQLHFNHIWGFSVMPKAEV